VNAAILLAGWALPGALAVKLFLSWNGMPERVAVHFGFDLQPNRWSSKLGLALQTMFLVIVQAAVLTWFLFEAGHGGGLVGLVMLPVSLATVCAFWQVINYNSRGTPFRPRWVVLPLLALFACVAVVAVLQRAW
jgi:hypothetical protein